MLPLNYHHLYYFWVTAKTGSISKAKDRLLLSQPALSLQIQQLERSLGRKLLDRGRAGVALTPEGKVAFEHCERIFPQGEALLASLRDGGGAAPVLRIGLTASVGREVVLKVLDWLQAYELKTTLFTGTVPELKVRLERHTLDVAVSDSDFSPMLGRDFRSKLAGEIPVFFVAAPALKKQFDRFPNRGREVAMLLRSPEAPVRKDVEDHLSRAGMRLAVEAETDDVELIRILALQGRGVAVLNALAIRDDVKAGALVRLQTQASGIRERVWLISSVHPHSNAALASALGRLMSDFAVKAASREAA